MEKTNKTFSIELAFEVMRYFLDKYWEKNKLDDIGNLLSSMMLFSDKNDKVRTFDPAVWSDWIDSVKKIKMREDGVLSDPFFVRLTEENVFNAMVEFLYNYEKIDNSKDIRILVKSIESIKFINGTFVSKDSVIVQDWKDSINKIMSKDFEIPYSKFVLKK